VDIASIRGLHKGKPVQINNIPLNAAPSVAVDASDTPFLRGAPGAFSASRNAAAESTKSNAKRREIGHSIIVRMPFVALAHAGWLTKRANSLIASYKQRYFILVEGNLSYYDGPLDIHGKPRGAMDCARVRSFQYGAEQKGGLLTVQLYDGVTTWKIRFLSSDSDLEVYAWLRKLQYACRRAPLNYHMDRSSSFVDRIERMSSAAVLPLLGSAAASPMPR
jgi:hypothetical protein